MRYYERERREFVRVRVEIPVRYRFLSHDPSFDNSEPRPGVTTNLSGGGLLLAVNIPDPNLIPGLLTEKIFLGVEMDLPGQSSPVRALTRAAWVESVESEPGKYLVGLRFKEITREDQDRIFQFIIHSEMS